MICLMTCKRVSQVDRSNFFSPLPTMSSENKSNYIFRHFFIHQLMWDKREEHVSLFSLNVCCTECVSLPNGVDRSIVSIGSGNTHRERRVPPEKSRVSFFDVWEEEASAQRSSPPLLSLDEFDPHESPWSSLKRKSHDEDQWRSFTFALRFHVQTQPSHRLACLMEPMPFLFFR